MDLAGQPLTAQGLELLDDVERDGRRDAITVLRRAVDSGEWDAPRVLAQALVASNQYRDACAVLSTAVEHGRRDLLTLLGSFAADAGLPDLADASYRKAVADGDPGALNDYGDFLVDQERYGEAIEVLTRAVAGGDPLAPANLVLLYADELDDLDTAMTLGERYLSEERPRTLIALADVYERLGRLDEAERLYRRSIELGASRAHVLFGRFLKDFRHDVAGAEREFWLAFDNDEAGWGYHLGLLLLETGRNEEAADVLHHAASWGDLDAGELLSTMDT